MHSITTLLDRKELHGTTVAEFYNEAAKSLLVQESDNWSAETILRKLLEWKTKALTIMVEIVTMLKQAGLNDTPESRHTRESFRKH